MRVLQRSVFSFGMIVLLVLAAGCGGGGGGGSNNNNSGGTTVPQDRRSFRAIAGISMGTYGAMNIGTKHSDTFATIGALGGPIDLGQLLLDLEENLQVKPVTEIPQVIGDPVTFDHQLPYP